MTFHQAHEEVTFTCQYPVRWFGGEYKQDEEITVGIVRDWDEEEGLGEGGPWGWGGYSSKLLAELSGGVTIGHTHFCINCHREVEHGDFKCEQDSNHGFELCEACATAGIKLNN